MARLQTTYKYTNEDLFWFAFAVRKLFSSFTGRHLIMKWMNDIRLCFYSSLAKDNLSERERCGSDDSMQRIRSARHFEAKCIEAPPNMYMLTYQSRPHDSKWRSKFNWPYGGETLEVAVAAATAIFTFDEAMKRPLCVLSRATCSTWQRVNRLVLRITLADTAR